MSFNTTESRAKKVVAIRQDDSKFFINDGLVQYPRAMLHILPDCPVAIRNEFQWAMAKGYIKAIAHVPERELIFSGLTK